MNEGDPHQNKTGGGKPQGGQARVEKLLPECESTNTELKILAEAGATHGSWVSCVRQTAGRGRLGRSWLSGAGNLYLSLLLRIPQSPNWSWIPLTTAVAVARCLNSQFPGLGLKIKWPNDLVVLLPEGGPAKVGGILCEGHPQVSGQQSPYIVVGLGLNCTTTPPVQDQAATNLSQLLGSTVTADLIRGRLIEEILAWTQETSQNTQKVREAYQDLAIHPKGSPIQWGDSQSGEVIDLGPSSELVVKTSDGAEIRLYSEDISLRK